MRPISQPLDQPKTLPGESTWRFMLVVTALMPTRVVEVVIAAIVAWKATAAIVYLECARYSFDATLSWNKMSADFIEQSNLAPKGLKQSSTATSPRQLGPALSPVSSIDSRVGWPSQDYPMSERDFSARATHSQPDFSDQNASRLNYPPISTSPGGYTLPPLHHGRMMLPHPPSSCCPQGSCDSADNADEKLSIMGGHKRSYTGEHPQRALYYPYPYQSSPAMPSAQQAYYYSDNLPVPANLGGPSSSGAKNQRKEGYAENDQELEQVEPGHPATRMDVEARPRPQKLRFPGDLYTPQLVLYNGQAKEGLCDTCEPGKWLQIEEQRFW